MRLNVNLNAFVHRRRFESFKRSATHVLNDSRSPVLGAIAAGWFLSLGVRMVYPVLLPHIRTAYGLDLVMAGLLLTVLWGRTRLDNSREGSSPITSANG